MLNVWYLGLEAVDNRYTGQLTNKWMPGAFKKVNSEFSFKPVLGETPQNIIEVGVVFDAAGRNLYALSQVHNFIELMQQGQVKNGDVVYIQDMWTPGIEAIFYTAHLYDLQLRYYTTCWAQSFDEYDFTYDMRSWLRNYELSIGNKMDGIFVGNQLLKDLLRQGGITSPIHVTSIPFDPVEVKSYSLPKTKEKAVVFASRFDWEKRPFFMLEVAEKFLIKNPDWEWWLLTSSQELRSNEKLPELVARIREIQKTTNDRLMVEKNLSKKEYYDHLARASVIFNSALQDWVSFTILEGTSYGCAPSYPRFRGFPEFLSNDSMYDPFSVDSAVEHIASLAMGEHDHLGELSYLGMLFIAHTVVLGVNREYNIWTEFETIKSLLKE